MSVPPPKAGKQTTKISLCKTGKYNYAKIDSSSIIMYNLINKEAHHEHKKSNIIRFRCS